MRSWINTIVVGVVILISAILATPTLAKEPIQVTRGQIATYADGLDKGYDISGMATMVRSAEGYTSVTLRVQGLAPNTNYGVHVHNQACSNEAGGSHYQHEIGGAADEVNEIWPAITTNSGGYGFSQTVNDFVARAEARSVVIHDTDNSRLACADLRLIGVSPYTFNAQQIEELAESSAMAANPELMAAGRYQPVEITIPQLDSADYAANPELLVVQRYEFIGDETDALGSTQYAANPELLVAQRYEFVGQDAGSLGSAADTATPEQLFADYYEFIAEDGLGFYAANPELLVIQRYEFIGQEAGSLGSTDYAANPELMAAERYETETTPQVEFVDTFRRVGNRH
ncbi:MAG: superoxide dismutase family protein [Anaerolineales bacterium]|nr:superoxide dismutase family protein [Anaerolineales bacterium]